MQTQTNLFYSKVLTLKFNLCDLNHVFKYSRSVCQVVDKAILRLVPTGERVTWSPCCPLLCPASWQGSSPDSRLLPLEEKAALNQRGGALLALRGLETDWKHGNTPGRRTSFPVTKLSGQIECACGTDRKPSSASTWHSFTGNLSSGNRIFSGRRVCRFQL